MAIGDIVSNLFSGGGGVISLIFTLGAWGVVVGTILGIIIWIVYKKKRWFINCEFKIPRSDGRLINSEWGKASYNAKKGVVLVKRKGIKATPLKPFDIKRYLQGANVLTVIQVGIREYLPVLPESFIEMVDDKTGESAAFMKIRVDTTESKSWKSSFEREAKNAYSIESLLQQFAPFIGWGIIIFLNFLGFAILYTRIT